MRGGRRRNSFHLKANVELHTICGRDAAGVQAARAQLGWQHATTDWREVVESPLIDIVDIGTPNDSHAEIAIAAAEKRQTRSVRKTACDERQEGEAMFAAAQKAKIVHMVCHNYRRIPAIALAKKMIGEGALGKIFHFRARYAQDWLADPEFPIDWRLQKETSGSGTHSDINSHIIDLGALSRRRISRKSADCVHTFVPERPLADSSAQRRRARWAKSTVPDSRALFIGWMENGVLANLEATRYALGRKNHIEIEINGSKGSLYFDFEDMNRLKFYNGDDPKDRQGFRDILVTAARRHPTVCWQLVAAGTCDRLRTHVHSHRRRLCQRLRRRKTGAADV